MKHALEVLMSLTNGRKSAQELADELELDLPQVYAALVCLEAQDKIEFLPSKKCWEYVG